jgi:phage host-nuclease inhibitor protein Gam
MARDYGFLRMGMDIFIRVDWDIMKKYKLTEEHRAQLKSWADKWIANGMGTKAMDDNDRAVMRRAIRGLYESANLIPPPDERIVFVSSPFIMRFAAGFASAIWWLRSNPGKLSVDAATRAATYAATYELKWHIGEHSCGIVDMAKTVELYGNERDKLAKEITSLRESLKEAVEALDYALELDAKGFVWRGYVLDELAKIKSEHGDI